jgi:SAM-dependent methyltransferase
VRDLPSSLEDLLAEALRGVAVESVCHVVQLFGGGGELTQVLVAFADRLIAVDRSEEKLQEMFRRWPGVETATGTSEAIPLPDDSVDVVVVADPLELASAAEPYGEIARVLRSGGALVVVTHGECWPEHCDLEPLLVDLGRAGSEDWRRGLEETGLFTTVVVAESDRDVDVGVDGFVALVGSWGWIADLPGEERAAVLGAVRNLLGDRATVTVRYHIEVCAARAIGG